LGKWEIQSARGDNRSFALGTFSTESKRELAVAVIRTPEQGPLAAQDTTRDLIEDIDPTWIILVGIAGGFPEREFTLGDVVVGSRLHDFVVGAYLEGVPPDFVDQGGPMKKDVQDLVALLPALKPQLTTWNTVNNIGMPRPDVELNDRKLYGNAAWRRTTKEVLEYNFQGIGKRPHPIVTSRGIASSGFLVKDTALLNQWRRSARDVFAVEMELSGVYAASQRRHKQYPVLAIRGISDIVGFKRGPDWTSYACHSAAAFCFSLFKCIPERFLERDLPVVPLRKDLSTTPPRSVNQEDVVSAKPTERADPSPAIDPHRYLLLLAMGSFDSPVRADLLFQVIGLQHESATTTILGESLASDPLVQVQVRGISLTPSGLQFVQIELTRRPELAHLLRAAQEKALESVAAPFCANRWLNRPRLRLIQDGAHIETLGQSALRDNKRPLYLSLLPALREYYDLHGNWKERLRISELGLTFAVNDDLASASIKVSLAWLLSQQDHFDLAAKYVREAIEHSRRANSPAWECEAMVTDAIVQRRSGRSERALISCNEALALLPRLSLLDRYYAEAWIHYELGLNARNSGNIAVAHENILAAQQVLKVDDLPSPTYNLEFAWLVHTSLGQLEQLQGALDAAGAKYLQAESFFRTFGSKGQLSTTLYLLASLCWQRKDLRPAEIYAQEALALADTLGIASTGHKARSLLSEMARSEFPPPSPIWGQE
jgi:nucleoside phosphorylase/tetratricopeptide (TPR) repeat protein